MSEGRRQSPAIDRPLIVHIISGLGVGGAERTLQGLVNELEARGYHSVIVSLSGLGEIGDELQHSGLQVIPLHWAPGRFSLTGFIQLIRLLRDLKPQLIQTWMYHADMVGALVSYWIRSSRLVWNIRGSLYSMADFPLTTRMVIRACSILSARPDAVIVNSHQGQSDHQAIGYKTTDWKVIHNGIDTQRFVPSLSVRAAFRQSLGIGEADRLIGCVARFHPKKGHQFLIQSFARLLQEAEDFYLALVGQGLEDGNAELTTWIRQAGVGERVFLLGPSERSENIYPGLDLLAMPSLYGEGFPNAVAEAMACGVPCVVTDVGDAALLVGETGRVVVPGDVNDFSDAMAKMAQAVAMNRQAIAEKTRDRIVTQFNFARMVSAYEDLYHRLIHLDEIV